MKKVTDLVNFFLLKDGLQDFKIGQKFVLVFCGKLDTSHWQITC